MFLLNGYKLTCNPAPTFKRTKSRPASYFGHLTEDSENMALTFILIAVASPTHGPSYLWTPAYCKQLTLVT